MLKARPGIFILFFALLVFGGCSDDPASPDPDNQPKTIQELVDAASPGDTIIIAPGIYTTLHEHTPINDWTVQIFCAIKSGVVVRGATGNPADVIIDAGGEGSGFWFYEADGSTGLADLTVRNARWGVMGIDASPWIDNCVFENNGDVELNPSSSGAGMYFDRSLSLVTNCIFRNNEAASGGGATFSQSSDVRIENCIFTGNHSTGTGGCLVVGNNSLATLINCSILDNTAATEGGGIYNNGYSLMVSGGFISGNSAGNRGGGCAIRNGIQGVLFDGVVITDNVAPEAAQGYVWDYSSEITIRCCDTNHDEWVGEIIFADSGCGGR